MMRPSNPGDDNRLQQWYEESMRDLEGFFDFSWKYNRPSLHIVPSRAAMDQVCGKPTEPWVVGHQDGRGVFLLAPSAYPTDSNHQYSEDAYRKLLKHELAHAFFRVLSDGEFRPLWLSEGVSLYVAAQHSPCSLDSFLAHYDKESPEVYAQSGYAVQRLIETYGKEKLLLLIKSLSAIESDFGREFRRIYGVPVTYDVFR